MRFFICDSALSGQPDHKNLGEARLLGTIRTAPRYRLHSVKNGAHPGLYEVDSDGVQILGEVYEVDDDQYESLMAAEPPDLYEAEVELEDGSLAHAMIYPRELVEKHHWPDISHYGSWVAFKSAEG